MAGIVGFENIQAGFKQVTGANMANVIGLHTREDSGNNNYYSTFYYQDAVYQIPSGKSFYILKAIYMMTGTPVSFWLGYGDTSVGLSSAAAPTTPISFNNRLSSEVNYRMVVQDIFLTAPALKYLFVRSAGSASAVFCNLLGVLV